MHNGISNTLIIINTLERNVTVKQVLIKQGTAVVEEIPAPQVEAGRVLVKVQRSCISIGTEMSGVVSSGLPLWKRALTQPENVKKGLQMIKEKGINSTRELINAKLSAGQPTGYSAAGIVIAVGEGINDIRPGDRVACAGAQCAFHAEYISVPRNLLVPVPDKLDMDEASTVTLGAIAMQGLRRAMPTLGETFVVIGLGILGQLTVQMLKANGCQVIGSDIDTSRIDMAKEFGMDIGIGPGEGEQIDNVFRLTGGIGADGVIITAATPSNEVISTAFKMCRKKGRVVLVGAVGLDINRDDIYQKELDFFISTSYGPGRYDNKYEEQGLEYPVAYVRWTENRNMAEYLRLISDGKIQIKPMIESIYEIDRAAEAYERLKSGNDKPLMVLLSYPETNDKPEANRISTPIINKTQNGLLNLALIGAGGFSVGMHLPNLKQLPNDYSLYTVVDRLGHVAKATAEQFGVQYSSTDYEQVLSDPKVDAILIATRHNLHAQMLLQALEAGKHVLVEKPLALTTEELEQIKAFYQDNNKPLPLLLTGFNRRFSPYARRIKELIKKRSNPMIINYRMNAGYLPMDHWGNGDEGGGRNRGEGCHIYDLFTYFTDSKVVTINAQSIKPCTSYYAYFDNFVASMTFEDGSLATLTYTAMGNSAYPKEQMEVYYDGKVIAMNDYNSLNIYGASGQNLTTKIQDKGHLEELKQFACCIKEGTDWPSPLWQQVQATEIANKVEMLL